MHTIAISNQKGEIGEKKAVTIMVPVATKLGVYWDTLAQLLIGEKRGEMMAPAKRKNVFFRATQETPKQTEQESTVKPSNSDSVVQQQNDTLSEPQGNTATPLSGFTALPSQSITVELSQRETSTLQESETVGLAGGAKKEAKTSIYFTPEEVDKLDDLAYEHKKRTGKRINRNAIVRYLVDHCNVEDLQNIE